MLRAQEILFARILPVTMQCTDPEVKRSRSQG